MRPSTRRRSDTFTTFTPSKGSNAAQQIPLPADALVAKTFLTIGWPSVSAPAQRRISSASGSSSVLRSSRSWSTLFRIKLYRWFLSCNLCCVLASERGEHDGGGVHVQCMCDRGGFGLRKGDACRRVAQIDAHTAPFHDEFLVGVLLEPQALGRNGVDEGLNLCQYLWACHIPTDTEEGVGREENGGQGGGEGGREWKGGKPFDLAACAPGSRAAGDDLVGIDNEEDFVGVAGRVPCALDHGFVQALFGTGGADE
jgi:hypothetical protein